MGELTEFAVLIMVFSAVVIGVGAFQSELFRNYGVTSTTTVTLNRTAEISNITSNMQKTFRTDVEGGSNDLFLEVATGAIGSFKIIMSIPGIIDGMLTDISNLTGGFIPGWFVGIISGIILLIVLLKIVSLILKGDV